MIKILKEKSKFKEKALFTNKIKKIKPKNIGKYPKLRWILTRDGKSKSH